MYIYVYVYIYIYMYIYIYIYYIGHEAIDCEMVATEDDPHALVRLCVCDGHCNVVLGAGQHNTCGTATTTYSSSSVATNTSNYQINNNFVSRQFSIFNYNLSYAKVT